MMHENLWRSGGKLAAKLEGSYIPLGDLRRYEPSEQSLNWRHGKQINKLREVLNFIRYTVDAANNRFQ